MHRDHLDRPTDDLTIQLPFCSIYTAERASRLRYFKHQLLQGLLFLTLALGAGLVEVYFGRTSPWFLTCQIGLIMAWGVLLVFSIMETIRRLHDCNESGKLCWLLLIPLVNIYISFKVFFQRGTSSENLWGEALHDDSRIYNRPLIAVALMASCAFASVSFVLPRISKPSMTDSPASAHPQEVRQVFTRHAVKPRSDLANRSSLADLSEEERRQLLDFSKAPCYPQTAYELVKTMHRNRHFRAIIQFEQAYTSRCGAFIELRWAGFDAAKALGDFQLAVAKVSKLIEDYPEDKDYLVWRGQVFESQGVLPRAAADYESALRLQPKLTQIPLNLAKIYEQIGEPCRSFQTLSRYQQVYPELARYPEFISRLQRLSGACKPETAA